MPSELEKLLKSVQNMDVTGTDEVASIRHITEMIGSNHAAPDDAVYHLLVPVQVAPVLHEILTLGLFAYDEKQHRKSLN